MKAQPRRESEEIIDIVDTQVHANVLGTEVTLAIMDALGIQGLLYDECAEATEDGALHPGYRLANRAFRSIGPNAEAAALRYPERFAFLMRVDPLDPGIECWIDTLSAAPGSRRCARSSSTQPKARCSSPAATTDSSKPHAPITSRSLSAAQSGYRI